MAEKQFRREALMYLMRGMGEDTIAPLPTNIPSDLPLTPSPLPAPPSAIQSAYKDLLTQQQNSQNPLDYVSPQAAVAAGLNAQAVYDAWSKAIARFPTQQAALAAGIPAGVVTQLWQLSRQAAATQPANFLDQKPLGVANKYLLGGAAGIFLLASLRRRR